MLETLRLSSAELSITQYDLTPANHHSIGRGASHSKRIGSLLSTSELVLRVETLYLLQADYEKFASHTHGPQPGTEQNNHAAHSKAVLVPKTKELQTFIYVPPDFKSIYPCLVCWSWDIRNLTSGTYS